MVTFLVNYRRDGLACITRVYCYCQMDYECLQCLYSFSGYVLANKRRGGRDNSLKAFSFFQTKCVWRQQNNFCNEGD